MLTTPISETTVCELHRRIVGRSVPAIAAIYSAHRRRIAGSAAVFPNPLKVPALMEGLGRDIAAAPATPRAAFDAHFGLRRSTPSATATGEPRGC